MIYNLLAGSPIASDLDEFLKWCKGACQNYDDRIVDLNEVGEFFSEQIAQRILDLKSMPATGFHFIQMFFVSVNMDTDAIIKTVKPKKNKKKKKASEWTNLYANLWDEPEKEEPEPEEDSD